MSTNSAIEWTEIPGFPGYHASEDGLVLGPAGRILKAVPNDGGYLRVQVRQDGRSRSLFVHKAVLLAFAGPCPVGHECRHKDGNQRNNTRGNLAWGTKVENIADKQSHGTQPRGERAGTAKLTEADVREIRRLVGTLSLRQLAANYGVSHTAIRRAATGVKWKHIA
jgi:hypothetical protein